VEAHGQLMLSINVRRPGTKYKEIEKFIIRQPPKGEKDDYDSEYSWISDGLPSSNTNTQRLPFLSYLLHSLLYAFVQNCYSFPRSLRIGSPNTLQPPISQPQGGGKDAKKNQLQREKEKFTTDNHLERFSGRFVLTRQMRGFLRQGVAD